MAKNQVRSVGGFAARERPYLHYYGGHHDQSISLGSFAMHYMSFL
jgi:hypothetical protein